MSARSMPAVMPALVQTLPARVKMWSTGGIASASQATPEELRGAVVHLAWQDLAPMRTEVGLAIAAGLRAVAGLTCAYHGGLARSPPMPPSPAPPQRGMHDAAWRRPSRRRAVAGLIAALLTQALWLWLLHLERLPGGATERRVAVVRLLPAQTQAPKPARAPAAPQRLRTERPRQSDTLRAEPTAAADSPTDPRGDTRPDPTAARAAAPAGEARSTLNLALPRGRAASEPVMARQVREDARSHSERRTLEWTIADGAGTLPVDDQASASGSGGRIVRQGSKCTRVYDSRIAALNPMDATLKGIPPSAGNCFN